MTMMKCKNFLSFWNAFNSILYFLSTKLHYVHYKLNWKKANLKRQNESSPFLELKLISIILKKQLKKLGYLKLLKKWYASLLVLFKNPKISTQRGSFFKWHFRLNINSKPSLLLQCNESRRRSWNASSIQKEHFQMTLSSDISLKIAKKRDLCSIFYALSNKLKFLFLQKRFRPLLLVRLPEYLRNRMINGFSL